MNYLHYINVRLKFILIFGAVTAIIFLIIIYIDHTPITSNNRIQTEQVVQNIPKNQDLSTTTASVTDNIKAVSTTTETNRDSSSKPGQKPQTANKLPSPTLDNTKKLASKPNPAVAVPTPIFSENRFSINSMLDGQNQARLNKKLLPLSWSNELAQAAQAWSQVLKNEECQMRHDPDNTDGENIYWLKQSGGDISGLVSNPNDANDWWINEEKFYNYSKNTCRKNEQCGHYTQIVWTETTTVGCGVSSCLSGKERTDIWVCRYNPAGNDGGRPY